jgi:hypothetical protein
MGIPETLKSPAEPGGAAPAERSPEMEYRFEDLSIDVDGAQVGYFTGSAYFEPDRGGLFFVQNDICMARPEIAWISRKGSPLQVELFRAIEAALYASPHARDAWAAHCENDRADAA